MTEPYIEKAAGAMRRAIRSDPSYSDGHTFPYAQLAQAALDGAFAELAANPPEEMVEAGARVTFTYQDWDEDLDAHYRDVLRGEVRASLSAAFSALRSPTKGDSDG